MTLNPSTTSWPLTFSNSTFKTCRPSSSNTRTWLTIWLLPTTRRFKSLNRDITRQLATSNPRIGTTSTQLNLSTRSSLRISRLRTDSNYNRLNKSTQRSSRVSNYQIVSSSTKPLKTFKLVMPHTSQTSIDFRSSTVMNSADFKKHSAITTTNTLLTTVSVTRATRLILMLVSVLTPMSSTNWSRIMTPNLPNFKLTLIAEIKLPKKLPRIVTTPLKLKRLSLRIGVLLRPSVITMRWLLWLPDTTQNSKRNM